MAEDAGGAAPAPTLPPPPSHTAVSADDSDRRPTTPGKKRLLLTLSVLLSFLAGLPFLLKSTEIYRSPLPYASLSSLPRSDPPSVPCRFHALFLRPADPDLADRLALSISDELRRRRRRSADHPFGCCGGDFAVSVTVDSRGSCVGSGAAPACLWSCGAVDPAEFAGRDDEAVDELLDSALNGGRGECSGTICCGGGGGGTVYSVVVVQGEEGDERQARVVVGKHRHAWMVGRIDEEDAVSMIGKIFAKYFMNGGVENGGGKEEFMPVGSDGSVVLSFSLLNADPNDWVYDWEFQKIGENMLAPVAEALAPIANISIESQVLYHTPKSSNSLWDDKLDSWILSIGDLPFFVNSNEWHLDTSISATGRSKVLQFVVYVPSARECPLYLQLPDGKASKTNAFISPMWGGVVVWNPPQCSSDSQKMHTARNRISAQDLQKILEVFVGQLRLLFGVNSSHKESGISKFIASEKGFTEWELDVLYRHHACSNILSCLTTLESLSNLVQSLPRMIVTDEIGKQVKLSLEAAYLAQRNASLGINDASAESSTKARALAEDAFFHPSIMSISYSSIEHYFAIYMPFFAPVCLHVLLAAIKEVKRYRRERAKYLAFLAAQAGSS
ncbi:GPI transamidase component PIG-S [Ananas comosus]|uniref:GPI transamidase component PIG-S n=1 Tax=Ananas comosus TaxID=4615 RepID=A0A199W4P1_ANACO|nr:GPI transamidase component PIG-S [Ananas comosus]